MKKSMVLFVAIATASLLQASELWWTVAGADSGSTSVDGTATTWDTAKLYASSDGFNYGSTELLASVTAADLYGYDGAFTDLGTYDSSVYSFYVELLDGSDVVGRSYASLSSPVQGATPYSNFSGSLDGGDSQNPHAASSVYSFSQFTTSNVVPEPTSGLLVLFGMMALGLKRKRV